MHIHMNDESLSSINFPAAAAERGEYVGHVHAPKLDLDKQPLATWPSSSSSSRPSGQLMAYVAGASEHQLL